MQAPFEYDGSAETCIGCAATIKAGDTVAPISADRPDRLLCVSCWWLHGSHLPLPSWSRRRGGAGLAAHTWVCPRGVVRRQRRRVPGCARSAGP